MTQKKNKKSKKDTEKMPPLPEGVKVIKITPRSILLFLFAVFVVWALYRSVATTFGPKQIINTATPLNQVVSNYSQKRYEEIRYYADGLVE